MVGGLLLRGLLGTALSKTILLFPDADHYMERFIVIRAFFPHQPIGNRLFKVCLDDLLQDSLAIKKEFLILQVLQNKPMYKLFCTSKTTINIYGSNQRSIASDVIDSLFLPPVASSPFPSSKYSPNDSSLAQKASAGSQTMLALVLVSSPSGIFSCS